MISYGTRKRRRPLVSLREHGRRTKISKENKQADKEDDENVTVNVEDTETTDKEHHREIDNENVVDIGSPAWVPDSPIYVPPATFSYLTMVRRLQKAVTHLDAKDVETIPHIKPRITKTTWLATFPNLHVFSKDTKISITLINLSSNLM